MVGARSDIGQDLEEYSFLWLIVLFSASGPFQFNGKLHNACGEQAGV